MKGRGINRWPASKSGRVQKQLDGLVLGVPVTRRQRCRLDLQRGRNQAARKACERTALAGQYQPAKVGAINH